MSVTILAGDWARKYIPEARTALTVPDGATIADALALLLRLPPDEVGMTALNGKAASRENLLRDGDTLKLYPVIIGG